MSAAPRRLPRGGPRSFDVHAVPSVYVFPRTRGNVGRAWREMSSLRQVVRRFESLLSRSEERILEAGGILDAEDG